MVNLPICTCIQLYKVQLTSFPVWAEQIHLFTTRHNHTDTIYQLHMHWPKSTILSMTAPMYPIPNQGQMTCLFESRLLESLIL